jgi:hypothetical protein
LKKRYNSPQFMKQMPNRETAYFFVDESGDPTFYDKYGNYIVGRNGCSRILILGFVTTFNPESIRSAFAKVRTEISNDPYLMGIPSLKKSARAFHAKDDCPEVRQAIFKTIVKLDFSAQFVVARKLERVFTISFNRSENRFYDYLVSKLFQNILHRNENNLIYFSKRGSRKRQKPLEEAIRRGLEYFQKEKDCKFEANVMVQSQTAVGEPCLQLIDYMNWAIYRVFTKGEMRYLNFAIDKISQVWDIYDEENYPLNCYDKSNPLDYKKISPL